MSTRKQFWSSVLYTLISLVITVLAFVTLPTEQWGITLSAGVFTFAYVIITVLNWRKISHGSGRTPQRPVRR